MAQNPPSVSVLGIFSPVLYPTGKINNNKKKCNNNNHKSHCLENGKPFPNKPHDFDISLQHKQCSIRYKPKFNT